MLEIIVRTGESGQMEIVVEGEPFDLGKMRREVASTGEKTKELPVVKRRKPGEGQMRHKDGSYLTKDEVVEEEFCRKNHIA